jgi:threonine dehydrogenase-like Zn-dependent dehydrogenase
VLGASYAPVSIIPMRALYKAVRVVFSVAYKVRDFEAAVKTLAASETRHRSMISEVIGLGELSSRFEMLRRERGAGRVLVDPWL